MFGLRLPELIIILVVLVLLFGAKKLPELGDALGKGLRAFKKTSDKAFSEEPSREDSSDATKGLAEHAQRPAATKAPSATADKDR